MIFVDDFYINRSRGMGRFVRCLSELSDHISLLGSMSSLPFPVWEQLFVYIRLFSLKKKTVIFPYNTAPLFAHKFVDTVIVVHDLMFLDEKLCSMKYITRPRSFLSFLYRRWIFLLVYKKANTIIFVIEDVEKDFRSRFIYSGKTHVLYNTIVPNLEKKLLLSEWSNIKSLNDEIVFVCVTGLAPTKNLSFLFNALSAFISCAPSIRWKLYLVGITSEGFETVFSHLSVDLVDRITIMENIDDDLLAEVYSWSDVLLFPSLKEGFGVPLIEAMAANLSIVCSNTSVMPSVCGDVAHYFDPASIKDFKKAVLTAIDRRLSLKEARKRYLLLFSNQAFKDQLHAVIRP